MTHTRKAPRLLAWMIAGALAFPAIASTAGCGNNSGSGGTGGPTTAPTTTPMTAPRPGARTTTTGPSKPGLSTGQKAVIVLAGAALLYYLYKKHQAQQQATAGAPGTTSAGKPQLYREEKGPNKGAIYYRDPKTHQPVWVTAPSGGVSVPASQVQQYAPDYQQYQGQQVNVPSGAQSVPATQFDPSLGSAGG